MLGNVRNQFNGMFEPLFLNTVAGLNRNGRLSRFHFLCAQQSTIDI
jgi:hypothetical protein